MSGRVLLATVAAGLTGLLLIAGLSALDATILAGQQSLTSCPAPLASGADQKVVTDLDPAQLAVAAAIIQTAADQGLPRRAAVIAVAVALQESRLRNLPGGDRDSVGVFQQRPSQGWGTTVSSPTDHRTPVQRLNDPGYAATSFYATLRQLPRWQNLPLDEAAQAVQRSGRPQSYATWEQAAETIVTTVTSRTCLTLDPAILPRARTAIDYARAQLGLPYQWGGDGPAHGDPGFDCSGLTQAAYAAAGISLPRTAQAQYQAGPTLPPGTSPEPGDLVFYGTPTTVHHVGLYIGNDLMIDAPHHGAPIRIEDFRWKDYLAATRPAAQYPQQQERLSGERCNWRCD
jgi:cell wall-associated NlpC family hydrolase